MLYRATVDVGAKTRSFETLLPELAITTVKETAPLFMECMMPAHIVTKVSEYMAGTVSKSASDTTDYKPRPPLESVFKPQLDTRIEIKRALSDPVS